MNKTKAVHKGNGLLPYPVIVSASQGDVMAIISERLLEMVASRDLYYRIMIRPNDTVLP